MKTIIKRLLKLIFFPFYIIRKIRFLEQKVKDLEDISQIKIDNLESIIEDYYLLLHQCQSLTKDEFKSHNCYLDSKLLRLDWGDRSNDKYFNVKESHPKLQKLLALLSPVTIKNHDVLRIGGDTDGGYVMLDDFANCEAAYSLGVDYSYTWDQNIAERNIPVYMYDHTVEKPKGLLSNMHFFQVGICAKKNQVSKNMNTIENLIAINKHSNTKNLILQMDIEGAEWDIFDTITIETLLQFKQIICEFHMLQSLESNNNFYNTVLRVFEKLTKYYSIFNITANNALRPKIVFDLFMPELLEISFIRKDENIESIPEWSLDRTLNLPNISTHPFLDISYFFPTL